VKTECYISIHECIHCIGAATDSTEDAARREFSTPPMTSRIETDFQNASCVQSVSEQLENATPIASLEIGAKSSAWLRISDWPLRLLNQVSISIMIVELEHLENLQVFMPAEALQSANISYAHES
jgi:hypothetical protein